MTLPVSNLITAGVEIAPPLLVSMLLRPVGEELALLVVLAQSLAVRGTGYSFYLLQVTVITEIPRSKIVLASTGAIVTFVKIRGVATRLAVALRSSRSRSWLLAMHQWLEEVLIWWLWGTLVSSFIVALMAGGPATVSVDQAVAPVLMTLLGIVGPVVTLGVVLADCLAVRGVGDMLYMLYQRLRIITDNSFCHITGC